MKEIDLLKIKTPALEVTFEGKLRGGFCCLETVYEQDSTGTNTNCDCPVAPKKKTNANCQCPATPTKKTNANCQCPAVPKKRTNTNCQCPLRKEKDSGIIPDLYID